MLATDYRHHHGAFPAVFDCPGAVPLDAAHGQGHRSSRSGKLGSASNAIVTWGEFWRAPVSIPSFFVVIATSSGTVWALLTVLILDIVVRWVSHSGRRQGTKYDQRNVPEVTGGT